MKKTMLVSFVAIAALGLMTSKAWGQYWCGRVAIANSTEVPIIISLACNDDAHATFPGGSETCILQPGQSTYLTSQNAGPFTASIQWNIIYSFYDGTSNINQRISVTLTDDPCADSGSSGLFYISQGNYTGEQVTFSPGSTMADNMGLHGLANKLVSALMNLMLNLVGSSGIPYTDEVVEYAINIGQQDYNLDPIATVDWEWFDNGYTPPLVMLCQGQLLYQYVSNNAWSVFYRQALPDTATVADFPSLDVGYTESFIGMQAGKQVAIIMKDAYAGEDEDSLSYGNVINTGAVVKISGYEGDSCFVAAFSDSSIEYYDSAASRVMQPATWNSAILQMCVNWEEVRTPLPQVLCGLANGAVEYYNGTAWQELHDTSWGSSIMQMKTDFYNVVVGLGNGNIEWWNGGNGYWTNLLSDASAPVVQMDVDFSEAVGREPIVLVVVVLLDGTISYFDGSNWTYDIHPNATCQYGLIETYWDKSNPDNPVPVILAGFRDGSVSMYQGGYWHQLQPATGNRVQYLSAYNWNYGATNCPLVYVYCCNYQFALANGSNTIFSYPAVPCTESICGNLDGDGRDDIITVDGSKWNIWYSEGEFLERSGPYDLGIQGTPLVGDVDGDGQDDFIMVDGASWYAWFSSMRHNWHAQRIGPSDLGIHGTPLLGDIDGDGQKDLIMVDGSLWYVWPSSLGYAQRVGPFNTGQRGLPAAGDIDGDGLADLVVGKGADWYISFSISPGQYSPWCGPYNMGVSGAPKMGDIDGDGLADLIAVVGSNWYVWFSTSQYQVRGGPYTKSVL